MVVTDEHKITWLIRKDLSSVLGIEKQSYAEPWDEDAYLVALKKRNCIGMTVHRESIEDMVEGFMLYELYKEYIYVVKFAVLQDSRHYGFGTSMMNKLMDKMSHQRRKSIIVDVDEDNMMGCLFLSNLGFQATVEDGYYRFVYTLGAVD